MSITSSSSSSSPANKRFITLKFTRRFLRSLMKNKRREYYNNPHQNNNNNNNMCPSRGIQKRIKLAAYASMARAVGPRKAWARALLRRKRHSFVVGKRTWFTVKKKKKKRVNMLEKLREVVPGGKDMDLCSLFEETAHFIHCLSLQVQVMQHITNHLSN